MPVFVAVSTMLVSPTMVISAVTAFVVVVAPVPPPPSIPIAIAVVIIIITRATIAMLRRWIPPLLVVRVSPSLVAVCALCQERYHVTAG